MIQHIQKSCSIKDNSTTLFEDNVTCIAQIKGGYIKGDRTKHLSPKFFYTHELQKSGEIDVQQIRLSDNLINLFTKSLPTSIFKKLTHKIGMRQLKDIGMRGNMLMTRCYYTALFFPSSRFCPTGFTGKVFNEVILIY